jgi:uncharacterized repeat protein (TIGR03803 family)
LYTFKGYPSDGAGPGTLIADASGNLYGTTTFGGNSAKCSSEGPGCGTAFELSLSGTSYRESVLHSFHGSSDGLYPTDGLLMDRTGVLYGTASFGGSDDHGTVFQLSPSKHGYAAKLLYSFQGPPDGFGPNGSLIADRTGTLYGTTQNGGTGCNSGCGTIFELRKSGSTYVETVLYDFQGVYDGAFPDGGLLAGGTGAFYGSTGDGGSLRCHTTGCGAVYELKPSGSSYTERVLYAFKGRHDGQLPFGTLLIGADKRLYGTTGYGGARNGTVFSVTR